MVMFVCAIQAHQSNPFEPFKHYLKRSDVNLEGRAEDVKFRLGSETKPSYYDIKLKFNIAGGVTFEGDVEITFQSSVSGLKEIVLNGENIDIKKGEVNIYEKDSQPINQIYDSHTYDKIYQKFTFKTKSALHTGKDYVIKVQYTGHMKDDLYGIYLSDYKDGGNTKKLITTHFGQFARRMMPCWDEPKFKAQFKFTITRDANMKSYSNAMLEADPKDNVDIFKATSVISPYLLALVISEFKLNENKNEKFGVIARPNAFNQTDYALKVGPKLIKAFDDWTDMPYHKITGVDKMELGAIPDFIAVSLISHFFMIT